MELEPLTKNVWTADHPHRVAGMPIGHRMTVVRLTSGDLWLHSPIPWSPELAKRLRELGDIAHWVAPSRTHDLWLDGWFEHEPEAASWAAPALAEAHPDRPFSARLARDLDAPWAEEFECLELAGAPRIGEWVFNHHPSRTAITADLLFNLGDEVGGLGGLLLRLAGTRGYARRSRLYKLLVTDRTLFEASLAKVIEWDFDRLVVGHGEPITDQPAAKLAAAWGV